MLRITVLSGARTGARLDLAKPVVRMGRAPDNDVAFDPNVDLDASAYHAEIRAENGQYVLVDLQSRNGLFLPMYGMQRIGTHPLQNGDQVQLGPQGPRIGIEILGPPVAGVPGQQQYQQQQPQLQQQQQQPYTQQQGQAPGQAAPQGGYAAPAQSPMGAAPGVPPMQPPGPPGM